MCVQRTSIFTFIIVLLSSWALHAQEDCIQKPGELAEAVQSDTLRIIDPNTYEESVEVTSYYIGEKSETATVIDKEGKEKRKAQIKHEFNYDMDPAKVVEKGNKKIYYYKKGDCYMIYKIKEEVG